MKHCQDCGTILRGRSDKKFCNDYCRCHYNNAVNKDRNLNFKEINCILKRNNHILEKLIRQSINHTTKSLLSLTGFNFTFFTHHLYGQNGEICICCYNYGYIKINKEEIIVKQANYLSEDRPNMPVFHK